MRKSIILYSKKGGFGVKELWKIFLTFIKIGAFTFGGGYAMIPLIQREAVENHNWVTDEDILDIVAIAESTPGPIAINAATFVGYRVKGFLGALAATFGVVLPSFVIILAISFVLRQFKEMTAVQYAFNGIRAGVLVLMLKALIKMFKTNRKGIMAYAIMGLSFLLTTFWNVNTFLVIALCAGLGLVSALAAERRLGK